MFILRPVPPYLPPLQECCPLHTCTYSKTLSDPLQIISVAKMQLQRLTQRAREDDLFKGTAKVCCTSLPCISSHYTFQISPPLPFPGFQPLQHTPSFRSRHPSSLIFITRLAPPQPTLGTQVIRVCLDLQCQVRNSNHQFVLGLPQG